MVEKLVGLYLSLSLCTWGWVIGTITLIPWLACRFLSVSWERIDYRNDEPLVLSLEVCRAKETMFERLWCHEIEAGWLFYLAPMNIMFPLYWVGYIQVPKLIGGALLVFQIFIYCAISAYFLLGPSQELETRIRFYLATNTVAMTVPVILLCIFYKSKELAQVSCLFFGLCLAGNFLLGAFSIVQREVNVLVLLLVLMPIFKFSTLFLTRALVKPLFLGELSLGEAVPIRRENAILFLVSTQAVFALLSRLLVVNLNDWGQYTIFMVVNTVVEFLMRYSPYLQDRFAQFCLAKSQFGKLTGVVVPLSNDDISTSGKMAQATITQNHQKQWYSLYLVGDMIAEYIALYVNIGLLITFRDAIMMLPLPVFKEQTDPFHEPMPWETWTLQTLIQIILEILIDWFCFSFEHAKLQLPILETWNQQSASWRLVTFTITSSAATSYITAFFKMWGQGVYHPCSGLDACSCDPTPGTLFAMYCAHLNHSSTMQP